MISHNKIPAVWHLKRHFDITVAEGFFKDIRLVKHNVVDVNRAVLLDVYPISGTAYYAFYKYLIIIIEGGDVARLESEVLTLKIISPSISDGVIELP